MTFSIPYDAHCVNRPVLSRFPVLTYGSFGSFQLNELAVVPCLNAVP